MPARTLGQSEIEVSAEVFSEILYEKMKPINPGIQELELYEFRLALKNLTPESGWASVELDDKETIETRIKSLDFYTGVQLKPRRGDRIVLDENIVRLTNMLFVGLVSGKYPQEWVRAHFYFDLRGFYFLTRTVYFTDSALAHFGGKPFKRFEQRQKRFERAQDIGYQDFKDANAEVDQCFIESVKKFIAAKGTPIVLGIAGPTAAGKTEIVERLRSALEAGSAISPPSKAGSAIPPTGKKVTSIEMDNFLTDRDYREEKGIESLGKAAIHFELFIHCLENTCKGEKVAIPRYDFVFATSSHDLGGNLKAGCAALEIEPADIVFIEGNFPFLFQEVARWIGIKVVYLTDDAIRMKRKWKRDIDYRKKYETVYFCNRFFKDQFLMAHKAYIPQMEVCDMVVDTTGAAIWATPEIARILGQG